MYNSPSIRKNILIIDDSLAFAQTLKIYFEKIEASVSIATLLSEAPPLLSSKLDLILLDLMLPDGNGLEFLPQIKQKLPNVPVVIITGHQEMENIILAMQLGALEYITKPMNLEELDNLCNSIFSSDETKTLSQLKVNKQFSSGYIVGKSKSMISVIKTIGRVSSSSISILITGETGTGKEVVARAIHNASKRNGPFIAINCSAVVHDLFESEIFGHEKGSFTGANNMRKGLFEIAGEGTIFLDEIGDMPIAMQPKLLRAIQEKEFFRVGGNQPIPFNARIVSATNQDLQKLIEKKRFREDLFFRLKGTQITIPPLRERREDIGELIEYLTHKIASEADIIPKQVKNTDMKIMLDYDWPGNIRELENVLGNYLINDEMETLETSELRLTENQSQENSSISSYSLKTIEKIHIEKVLKISNYNITNCAKLLEITRPTLRKKIQEYNLDKKEV